jgi:uncharacterized BrkB/YihY/UPF0761 family membrane protein
MTFSELGKIFAPLDKDFCLYFYFFSIFCFIVIVVFVILFLFMIIRSSGKISALPLGYMISAILAYGIMYFQFRLLYSMCLTSGMKSGSILPGSAAATASVANSLPSHSAASSAIQAPAPFGGMFTSE